MLGMDYCSVNLLFGFSEIQILRQSGYFKLKWLFFFYSKDSLKPLLDIGKNEVLITLLEDEGTLQSSN